MKKHEIKPKLTLKNVAIALLILFLWFLFFSICFCSYNGQIRIDPEKSRTATFRNFQFSSEDCVVQFNEVSLDGIFFKILVKLHRIDVTMNNGLNRNMIEFNLDEKRLEPEPIIISSAVRIHACSEKEFMKMNTILSLCRDLSDVVNEEDFMRPVCNFNTICTHVSPQPLLVE